jgi:hypothetical protein
VADIIKRPAIGPTKSNTDAADRLDAAISNPDYLCPPPGELEYTTYLTTWIYPVYAFDNMNLSAGFSGGSMEFIPTSYATVNYGAIDGSYTQLRWFISDGPYDSNDAAVDYGATDGTYINKLVRAESPDEELQLNCVINDTCSMDLI